MYRAGTIDDSAFDRILKCLLATPNQDEATLLDRSIEVEAVQEGWAISMAYQVRSGVNVPVRPRAA